MPQVNHIRCSPVEEQQVLQVISEEITLIRRLHHPNIVRLHGVTREGPLYNIFVEWCAGKWLYTDSILSYCFFEFTQATILCFTESKNCKHSLLLMTEIRVFIEKQQTKYFHWIRLEMANSVIFKLLCVTNVMSLLPRWPSNYSSVLYVKEINKSML